METKDVQELVLTKSDGTLVCKLSGKRHGTHVKGYCRWPPGRSVIES